MAILGPRLGCTTLSEAVEEARFELAAALLSATRPDLLPRVRYLRDAQSRLPRMLDAFARGDAVGLGDPVGEGDAVGLDVPVGDGEGLAWKVKLSVPTSQLLLRIGAPAGQLSPRKPSNGGMMSPQSGVG